MQGLTQKWNGFSYKLVILLFGCATITGNNYSRQMRDSYSCQKGME
jgi:hypothetical protein